jgi:polyferredoxin
MRPVLVKFALWFAFVTIVALFLRRGNWRRREKLIGYGISSLVFGIFFGPEPSPMHPVKDFIFRLGAMGRPVVVFLVFILVLLVASVVLNRSICGWGCQFGVLQDFINRLFRNPKDTKNVVTGYVPPFRLGNTVRVLTFLAMIVAAFAFSFDLVGSADPFRVFNPRTVSVGAAVLIGVLCLASIFIYRPFCHFFCPFGLIGWLTSKAIGIRIRVDSGACTNCAICARACPSFAMDGILKEKMFPPDCYTCGSCIAACPVHAVSLSGPWRSSGKGES